MKLRSLAFHVLLAIQVISIAKAKDTKYEVWGSDQSNSIEGQGSLGVKGSFLWIWKSSDIEKQISRGDVAKPLSCSPNEKTGPCNMLDVFPQNLKEYRKGSVATGKTLADLEGFGRLHGALVDPQNLYVNANFFAPNGGYTGIIDIKTKEAIGLFRVTQFPLGRSVHMSFWNSDGSAILIANLNGKAIERIDVTRDKKGVITNLQFNQKATLGLGTGMTVVEPASYFQGMNAHGNPLIGEIIGNYDSSGLKDTTPNGFCKENGCPNAGDGGKGGRVNNLPICPIPASNGVLYITLAGGGLLIANTATTPMTIVGEYGQNVVYGAGCGGVEANGKMFINSGVSASSAGFNQSFFALWRFNNNDYVNGVRGQNTPTPVTVFEDPGNSAAIGNLNGVPLNSSGQLPGVTTRRDSHGIAVTTDEKYVHVVDRLQNVVEVFNTKSFDRSTFDLTSSNGTGGSTKGVCFAKSVKDDPNLPLNDPAPDLMDITPDGKYLVIAFRGPTPVTVSHSTQGSCPGVGIVEINNGKMGKLVTVLRSTNTLSDNVVINSSTFVGGVAYSGSERSDVHQAVVIPMESKKSSKKSAKKGKIGKKAGIATAGQKARIHFE